MQRNNFNIEFVEGSGHGQIEVNTLHFFECHNVYSSYPFSIATGSQSLVSHSRIVYIIGSIYTFLDHLTYMQHGRK